MPLYLPNAGFQLTRPEIDTMIPFDAAYRSARAMNDAGMASQRAVRRSGDPFQKAFPKMLSHFPTNLAVDMCHFCDKIAIIVNISQI